jgi:hypothetical protein
MAHQDFDPDLNHLGRQLRGLSPRPCPIDRDAVMFRAGQASVPRTWLWPATTAVSTCLAITFAAALVVQPALERRSQVVPDWQSRPHGYSSPVPDFPLSVGPGDAPGEAPAASEEDVWPAPQTGYFHAEHNVLRWGLEGIAVPPPVSAPRPAEKAEMLWRSF